MKGSAFQSLIRSLQSAGAELSLLNDFSHMSLTTSISRAGVSRGLPYCRINSNVSFASIWKSNFRPSLLAHSGQQRHGALGGALPWLLILASPGRNQATAITSTVACCL